MENKMTEAEFLSKFKANGFEMYKTEDIKPKLDFYYNVYGSRRFREDSVIIGLVIGLMIGFLIGLSI